MRNLQFDPFGEPLHGVAGLPATQSRASKMVLRVGVGIFWALVVSIVTARVVYFDPDLARTFGAVASNCVHAFFSV